jgi:hypothetical protein
MKITDCADCGEPSLGYYRCGPCFEVRGLGGQRTRPERVEDGLTMKMIRTIWGTYEERYRLVDIADRLELVG